MLIETYAGDILYWIKAKCKDVFSLKELHYTSNSIVGEITHGRDGRKYKIEITPVEE